MAFKAVGPGWRQAIIEVRDQNNRVSTRAMGKNLTLGRTSNHDLPEYLAGKGWSDGPAGFPERFFPGCWIGRLAKVIFALAPVAFHQQLPAARCKLGL